MRTADLRYCAEPAISGHLPATRHGEIRQLIPGPKGYAKWAGASDYLFYICPPALIQCRPSIGGIVFCGPCYQDVEHQQSHQYVEQATRRSDSTWPAFAHSRCFTSVTPARSSITRSSDNRYRNLPAARKGCRCASVLKGFACPVWNGWRRDTVTGTFQGKEAALPKPYHIITDYYPSPMYANQIKDSLKSLVGPVDNLPGLKIMNSVPKPINFQQLFAAFVTYIHHPGNGYSWNGHVPGGSAYKLLDGDIKSSECATFANAFMMLAWAPQPYGLGLPKAQLTLESYSGRATLGFVSDHPVGGVLGLQANVTGQHLYFWANHKVVKYQNRFYDVMYNTSYGQKEDMAIYQVMPNEVALTPPAVAQPATFYPVEPTMRAAATHPGTQGSWFREQPAGQYAGPSVSMPF